MLIPKRIAGRGFTLADTPPRPPLTGTRRLQDLAEKQARKVAQLQAVALNDYAASSTQPLRTSSTAMLREGLGRSQSEYLPAPELTDVTRVPMPAHSISISGAATINGYSYPPTPKDTPRVLSVSPLRTLSHGPGVHAAGLSRSQTDSRLDHTLAERKLPPIGIARETSNPTSLGRLPLPTLSVKIPQYLPPSPSPLSGRSYADENETHQQHRLSTSHPSSSYRRFPSASLASTRGGSFGDDGLRLPRPSLSVPSSRYTSSASIETLKASAANSATASSSPSRSSASCASLARLLNHNEAGEWASGDQMVL